MRIHDHYGPRCNPRLPRVDAMGHRFGDRLFCICGQTWSEHQCQPQKCTAEQPQYLAQTFGRLAKQCRDRGITWGRIAQEAGVSAASVSKAFSDYREVGVDVRQLILEKAQQLMEGT